MTDENNNDTSADQPTLVEQWIADQQAWQKTALSYLDSMVQNDEFLVHLGNAMRGSLLAGKPYPTQPPAGAAEPLNEADDRLDRILHALHLIQGELRDLHTAVDELRSVAGKHSTRRKISATRRRKKKRTSAGPRGAGTSGGKDA